MLFNRTYQVLIGTVLGGSSIIRPPKGKNYYLSMRNHNKDWLTWKALNMPEFFANPEPADYNQSYRCNSSCCKELTEIRPQLFDGNKRNITADILDRLMDTALAVWFLDNGGKTGRNNKNAYLNLTRFTEPSIDLIVDYFCSLDIPCKSHTTSYRTRLYFTVEGTEVLLKTIAHCFPTFMYDRV